MSPEERYDFDLSWLITEARIHAGFTQEKLAKEAGTTQSSIARAERGAVLPSHGILKRIARAIGTTLLPPRFACLEEPTIINVNMDSSVSTQTTRFIFQQ